MTWISLSACFFNPMDGASDVAAMGTATSSIADTTEVGPTSAATATDTTGVSPTTGTSGEPLPEAVVLQLSFAQVKQFSFHWSAAAGADYYQLFERLPDSAEYLQLGENLNGLSMALTMPLHFRFGASYRLRACNEVGCTDSEPVDIVDSMAAAIGHFVPSEPDDDDYFGFNLALSADGDVLAIGAPWEDSGVAGDESDDSVYNAGAVYVFVRDGATWTRQAYLKAPMTGDDDRFGWRIALSADGATLAVATLWADGDSGAVHVFERTDQQWSHRALVKASNANSGDSFGSSVALSADGDILAVGASGEDSAGSPDDNSRAGAGAVYVFRRAGDAWEQRAYVKPNVTDAGDEFGSSVALSGDGATLAVGVTNEDGAATAGPHDNSASNAGAVYVFTYDPQSETWPQQALIKADNAEADDLFGWSVALSFDGDRLAVGAPWEDSAATGVARGAALDNSALTSGAVYMFVRDDGIWSQSAYIKASNTGAGDSFGWSVALSTDGNTLAVGASGESSSALGVGGAQTDDSATRSGAVYLFDYASGVWSQVSYVKPANPAPFGEFGNHIALSTDASTLAVGAPEETIAGAAYVF